MQPSESRPSIYTHPSTHPPTHPRISRRGGGDSRRCSSGDGADGGSSGGGLAQDDWEMVSALSFLPHVASTGAAPAPDSGSNGGGGARGGGGGGGGGGGAHRGPSPTPSRPQVGGALQPYLTRPATLFDPPCNPM